MKDSSLQRDIGPGHYDDDYEDLKSVQLLLSVQEDKSTASSSSSCTWTETQVMNALIKKKMSPATQTLHQLSQTVDQLDLLCNNNNNNNKAIVDSPPARNMCPPDFSQYEFSVAEILATAAKTNNSNNGDKKKNCDKQLPEEDTSTTNSDNNDQERALLSESSPALAKAKNSRRGKPKDTSKRTVVRRKKPLRVEKTKKHDRSTQRKAITIATSKKKHATSTRASSSIKSHQHGSYKSQAVEKWRGNRRVKVYQSMRQAGEAEGTHHGHIKKLVQTGEITNGFKWKWQQQQSPVAKEAPPKAKTEAKSKQKGTSLQAKGKKETPVPKSRRPTRSTASVPSPSSSSTKVPIKKNTTPVKHATPNRPRAKSVQRLKKDGSVSRTFPSMLQASAVTGMSRRLIRDCVKDRDMRDTDGLAWRLIETVDSTLPASSTKNTAEDTLPASSTKNTAVDTLPASSTKNTASNGKDDSNHRAEEKEGQTSDSVNQAPLLPEEIITNQASKEKQGNPFAATADTKKSEESLDNDEPRLDVSFVKITSPGKLGLVIRSIPLDDGVRVAVGKSTHMNVLDFVKACIVESVKTESHCEKVGIRPGDNLFLVQQVDGRRVLNGNYDVILEVARSDERPIHLCLARPLVKKLTSIVQSKAPSEMKRLKAQSEVDQLETQTKDEPLKMQSAVEPFEAQPEVDNNAPFCVLCRGGATQNHVHHAWCRHNPQFQKSGAHEVYRRITEGMKLGCNVCKVEFETGRIQQNRVHTLACKENQKVIFDVEELPQKLEVKKNVARKKKRPENAQLTKATSKKESSGEPTLKTKRGRSVKVSAKILTSDAYLSDIGRDGSDASDESEPQPKRRPVSSLFSAKRSPEAKKVVEKATSTHYREIEPKNGVDAATASRRNKTVSSKRAVTTTTAGNEQYASFAADYSSESDAEYDGSGELEITWEACPDPWGEQGFVDGDVVVFSKQVGVGNIESTLPSPRFAIDPLPGSCRYKKTHQMPNEGFHALLLRRDPLRVLSWGFSVHWHEFGGACLVSSVEPMSPAHAAVFVGAHSEDRSHAALRMNDMIMTVDGKEVGGMTVEAFNLTLELAGSELIIVVSRYKGLSHESAVVERELLSSVDKHINDPNRLHWADIGGGSGSAFRDIRKVERTELNYQSSPESHVPAHLKPSPSDNANIGAFNNGGGRNLLRCESDASTEKEKLMPFKTHTKSHDSVSSIKKVENIAEHQDHPTSHHKEESDIGSVLSSVEPTDLRSILEADEPSSNSDEFGEDGNAWCGCVCGKDHPASGKYFWIQCESCCSWYNVYQQCVGVGKKEAETMEEWTCWACGGEAESPEVGDKAPVQNRDKGLPRANRDKVSSDGKPAKVASLKQNRGIILSKETPSPLTAKKETISRKAQSDMETESTDGEAASSKVHKSGSLVFIQEHAWSGVNNPEGIARVTASHMDEEDGRTYDVKYIVGRSSKGVLARYVTPHSFD